MGRGSEPIREDWGTLSTSERMGNSEPIREDGGGCVSPAVSVLSCAGNT